MKENIEEAAEKYIKEYIRKDMFGNYNDAEVEFYMRQPRIEADYCHRVDLMKEGYEYSQWQQSQSIPAPVEDKVIDYIKWIRENWISTDDVWRRKSDIRDQRTDNALYQEYTAQVKYSYFNNKKGDYTVVFKANTSEEHFIAQTDTAEKADVIVKALNVFNHYDDPVEDKLQKAILKCDEKIVHQDDSIYLYGYSKAFEEIKKYLQQLNNQ